MSNSKSPSQPVQNVKFGPQAKDDSSAAGENAFITIDVMGNDLGGNAKQLWSLDQSAAGAYTAPSSVVTLASGARIWFEDGEVVYDAGSAFEGLAVGQAAQDSFIYAIRMSNGSVSYATVTVSLTGANDGPVAVADTASGHENETLIVDALANDTDADDGATFTLVSASAPAGKGGVSIAANQLAFDPGADFDHLAAGATETVVIDYTMEDEHGAQSSSTLTITLTGTNDGPVAVADAAAGHENEGLTIDVLANDTDVDDGAAFTLVSASVPAGGGSASIAGNQLVFDPGGDFDHLAVGESATVTLDYVMEDEHGAQSGSTVTVTVNGANDGPAIAAGDFTGSVLEAEPVTGIPAATTPTLAEAGANDGFASAQMIDRDAMRIASNPDLGDESDPAISVAGSIDSATDEDVYAIELQPGETITLDIDFALGYGSTAYPGYGTLPGLDAFIFIYDAAGTLLNSNDDAPIASGGEGSAHVQDSYLQFTASAAGTYYIVVHDWNGDGAMSQGPYTLQVSLDSQNLQLTDSGSFAFGDVDLSDGHSVIVTPQGGDYLGALTADIDDASTGDGAGLVRWDFSVANAAVQFLAEGQELVQSYEIAVSDGQGGIDQEIVTVTITGANDAPVITTALSLGEVVEDVELSAAGQIMFADVDLADGHSVSSAPDAADYVGTFTATLADPSTGDGSGRVDWSFSVDNESIEHLAAGQFFVQHYTVTVEDGHGGLVQQLVNITITGTNDGPVAAADTAAGDENETLTIDVLANDSDADGGATLTLVSASAPADKGGVSIVAGQLVFDPGSDFDHLAAGAVEMVTLSYTMEDEHGAQSSSTVGITVNGANDGPLASSIGSIAGEDGPAVTLTAAFTDVDDGDTHSYAIDTSGTTGSVTDNGDGTFGYDPAGQFESLGDGETATDQFTYTVTDANGQSSSATATVTISGVNDAPTATPITASTNEDSLEGQIDSILFVDDDRGLSGDATWLGLLDDLGYSVHYEAIASNGNPTSTLSDYDLVIWSNGDHAYTNLTSQNVAALSAYLDDGGRLLYAGGHSVYEENAAHGFIQTYLGLADYHYNMPYISSSPDATGPGGSYVLTDWAGGYYGGTMISAFEAAASTATVLMSLDNWYDSPDVAAVNDTGTFVAGTWGFDINQLGAAYREDFLADTLDALGGSGFSVDLLSTAADVEGDALTVTSLTQTAGTIVATELTDGVLRLVPGSLDFLAEGQEETLEFSYTIGDGALGTVNSVTITVTGANDAPTIVPSGSIFAGPPSSTFSGGYVDVTSPAAFTGTGAFSYEITFKTSTTGIHQNLLSVGFFNTNKASQIGISPDGKLAMGINNRHDAGPGAPDYAGFVADGEWHTAAFTHDGAGTFTYYLDGLEIGAFFAPGVDLTNGVALIGAANTDYRNPFQGEISDAHIWNRELSAAEVANLSPPASNDPGLIGSYMFSSGSAENVATGMADGIIVGNVTLGSAISAQVRELPDGIAGEGSATLTETGSILFEDSDLSDTHSATAVAQGSGYLGSLSVSVDQDSNKVDWVFTASDGALDGLGAGQIVTQAYTVSISDGNGGSAEQEVTITLIGAGDGSLQVLTFDGAGEYLTSSGGFNFAEGTYQADGYGSNWPAGDVSSPNAVYSYGDSFFATADGHSVDFLGAYFVNAQPAIDHLTMVARGYEDGVLKHISAPFALSETNAVWQAFNFTDVDEIRFDVTSVGTFGNQGWALDNFTFFG